MGHGVGTMATNNLVAQSINGWYHLVNKHKPKDKKMKFYKVIPYKIRRAISMAAIIGAPIIPTACGGLTPEPEPEPEPTREIEIKFNNENGDKILTFEALQNYANDKTVKTIYLIPTAHWNGNVAGNITFMRNNFLQPRLSISPKIQGRGDFDFKLGEASKVPNDSLWFVKNGWTINKSHQR